MDNTEAIKWLELLKQKNIEFDDYSEDTREIREEATRRFQKALSLGIQALENQKTGHWEYVQYDSNPKIGNYHCSVCRHIIIPFENQKYCPNCGAKMKGENK